MSLTEKIKTEIFDLSRKDKIEFYTKFFRALPGDICEGDKLLAIEVPKLRKLIVKHYKDLSSEEIKDFINSEYNEIRFFGQQVVLTKFKKAKELDDKKFWIDFLLKNIKSINHWNLVDTIYSVFAEYCYLTNDYSILEDLHENESIWQKRIAIVSNLYLFKRGVFEYGIKYCQKDISHPHEYLKKATGWVLREYGKYNEKGLIEFLQNNKNQI
ncbi:MAG: DNA alkylation repair protein, partial [Patescibacteria group bacterium]